LSQEIIERVYTQIGDESLDGLGLATPPPLQDLAKLVLERFLNSDEGKAAMGASGKAAI
jgi:hypothetical protein